MLDRATGIYGEYCARRVKGGKQFIVTDDVYASRLAFSVRTAAWHAVEGIIVCPATAPWLKEAACKNLA